MEGSKVLKLLLCILILVMSERMTTAYTILQPTVSTDQPNTPADQINLVIGRMDELERSHSVDVKEFNIRIRNLVESRKNDARVMTGLNQEVDELKRLRVKDLNLINMLTQRVGEVEQKCENLKEAWHDIYKETQNNLILPSEAAPDPDEPTPMVGDLSTHFPETSRPALVNSRGRIPSKHHGRIPRVNPSDNIVAFHAVLTRTISSPSKYHPVIFNKLTTKTGGALYSTNTGVFTCTQSGIYVFSWSTNVEGHKYIDSELVRNDDVIGSAVTGQGTGFESATSATSLANLAIGDEVWVRVAGYGSGSDILPCRSMFTGFRLR